MLGVTAEKIVKQLCFSLFIQSCGYFVKNQNVSTMQQTASNGYALSLSLRQASTLFVA